MSSFTWYVNLNCQFCSLVRCMICTAIFEIIHDLANPPNDHLIVHNYRLSNFSKYLKKISTFLLQDCCRYMIIPSSQKNSFTNCKYLNYACLCVCLCIFVVIFCQTTCKGNYELSCKYVVKS